MPISIKHNGQRLVRLSTPSPTAGDMPAPTMPLYAALGAIAWCSGTLAFPSPVRVMTRRHRPTTQPA